MAEKRRVVCPSCDSINAVPADRPAEAGRCGRCHAPLFQRRPIDVNASQLQKHIAESPVIVDFWAPWYGPCRAMAPIFAQAAQTLEPRARFVKVNVEENLQAASQYGVQGIPALFAFRGGKVAASHVGVTDSVALRNWVHQLKA